MLRLQPHRCASAVRSAWMHTSQPDHGRGVVLEQLGILNVAGRRLVALMPQPLLDR